MKGIGLAFGNNLLHMFERLLRKAEKLIELPSNAKGFVTEIPIFHGPLLLPRI